MGSNQKSRGRGTRLGPTSRSPGRLRAAVVLGVVAVIVVASVVAFRLLPPREEAEGLRVILMIGDGMGTGQLAVARYGLGPDANLQMDRLSHGGVVTTHSANSLVTDSAAAATALATGQKTNNGMVGVRPDGEVLPTVLERAEELGLATGLVTTTRLTHATPAAFATHVSSRSMEAEIAVGLLNGNPDIEVLLGGGRSYFLPSTEEGSARPDDVDLIAEARSAGYAYVTDAAGLADLDPTDSVLGLFHTDHMTYDLARAITDEPSLTAMTEAALDVLSGGPDGFFLMVEGGRIDHAGHANNLTNVEGETRAFDRAVGTALNFTLETPRTLLVITADHETGGLSVFSSDSGGPVQVAWSTRGHTANPVPLFAEGHAADRFSGALDNTDIGAGLIRLLEEEVGGRPPTTSSAPSTPPLEAAVTTLGRPGGKTS